MANLAPTFGPVTGRTTYTEAVLTTGNSAVTVLQASVALSDPDGDPLTAQYQTGNTFYGQLTWSDGRLTPEQAFALTALASESVFYADGPERFSARSASASWRIVDGALDFLAAGETLTYTVTWQVSDGTDADDVSITFTATGSGDLPVFGAFEDLKIDAVSGGGYDVAGGSLAGIFDVSDPDVNDGRPALSIQGGTVLANGTVSKAGTYGTLVLDPATGAYTYTPRDIPIERLLGGQVREDEFTIVARDKLGAEVNQAFTVTVTGANDPVFLVPVGPVSVTEVPLSSGTQDAGLSGGLRAFDFLDITDVFTFGIEGGTLGADGVVSLQGTYGALRLIPSTGLYGYLKDVAAIDGLADGQIATDSFTVKVTDSGGSTSSQTFTVTLTGANDAPTVTAPTVATVTETRGGTGYTSANLSGTIQAFDPDAGDVLSFGNPGLSDPDGDGIAVLTEPGRSLTLDTRTGAYEWAFSDAWVESWDDRTGFSIEATVPITVTDALGATAQTNLVFRLFGADEPIVVAPVADQAARERQAFAFTLPEGTFTDLEGDTLVLSASGLPDWLSFDAATGTFSGTPPLGLAQGDLVTVTVTATEGVSPDGAVSAVIDSAEVSFEIGIGRTITGTKVADTLAGGRFGDLIRGLAGDDRLSGLGGDDILLGEAGRDWMSGGDGNDVLAGATGDDRHEGGAGADVFVFGRVGGADGVLDFDLAEGDRIALEGVELRSWSERDVDGDGVLDTVLQITRGTVALMGTGDTDVNWRTVLVDNPLAA